MEKGKSSSDLEDARMESKRLDALVLAPIIQKIPRETEVRSDVLESVRWFHWVERNSMISARADIAK